MRTFVAVEVCNEEVLDSIARLQSDMQIKASPVSRKNMHFTLFFLGEISEQKAEEVKRALSGIVFSPIRVRFTNLGAFPSPDSPRVIWIGVDEAASRELVVLAKEVEKRLLPAGFRADKPFRAHLTIFRLRNRDSAVRETLARYGKTDLGTDIISELKLKKSVLTSNGPIYSDLLVVRAQ